MSLSSIITDLEAEGIADSEESISKGISRGIRSATLLTSKSSSVYATRRDLVNELFQIDLSASSEELEEDSTAVGLLKDGMGYAIALGLQTATGDASPKALEVASTVSACDDAIVYLVNDIDLERGEGLFDTLAPALERITNTKSSDDEDDVAKSTLVVVMVNDSPAQRARLEALASEMLSHTITTTGTSPPKSLSDVFDTVHYTTPSQLASTTSLCDLLDKGAGTENGRDPSDISSAIASSVYSDLMDPGKFFDLQGAGPVSALDLAAVRKLHPACRDLLDKGAGTENGRDPSDISSAIASSVYSDLMDPGKFFDLQGAGPVSALDLAAVRKLHPACRNAVNYVLNTVSERIMVKDDGEVSLLTNFGDLCEAAINAAMEGFDAASSPFLYKNSAVARKKRNDAISEILTELEPFHETQVQLLQVAYFENFRGELNKLRLSPNLPVDMEKVAKDVSAKFGADLKKLICKIRGNDTKWRYSENAVSEFRKKTKEYCTERLSLAKAKGSFRPLPRKGLTLGLHWLLPAPFGADFMNDDGGYAEDQFNPFKLDKKDPGAYRLKKSERNYVETGKKRMEVNPEDVMRDSEGSWKRKISPVKASLDMVLEVEDSQPKLGVAYLAEEGKW
eukprot:CAMPEP_0194398238 /NCGR_PEP_ID=MMETSP0174-20130528/125993_1 /TAXON_ID=216777 /ORGANISM="Proboscia alata, Strain PI-D3" /LENGTH=623 /DNA_ID=CAMNT_0039194513 /DNA_START=1018 /DNA_END=2886 /DNA_ORIENTATION=-